MTKPDFLVIGLSKCGTTWLYQVLRQHPEIYLPPVKEIHFFDEYFQLVANGDRSRYFSSDTYSRNRWRKNLEMELKRTFRFPSLKNIHWTLRFLFYKRDFEWYSMLFQNNEELVCGDITPAYAILDPGRIKQIRVNYPDLKIILMLRDPMERVWSHAKMELASRKGKSTSDISSSDLESFLFYDSGVSSRGMYEQIIRNWHEVFGESFMVELFDEVENDPKALIDKLCNFLDVRPVDFPEQSLKKVVFKGPPEPIPDEIRIRLAKLYYPEVVFVSEYLCRPELMQTWNRLE